MNSEFLPFAERESECEKSIGKNACCLCVCVCLCDCVYVSVCLRVYVYVRVECVFFVVYFL